jgi:hypothetical protein
VQPAKNPRPESTLSLLLANVKMDNHNSARLREIVAEADPDIILVVEADGWVGKRTRLPCRIPYV